MPLIRRHQAGAGVDHEQHDVRLFDRQQRLTGHARFDAVFGAVDTAGIDDDEFIAFDFSTTILAVTRQPREIRHQRIARMG